MIPFISNHLMMRVLPGPINCAVLLLFSVGTLSQDICDTVHCGSGLCIGTQNPTLPYFCRCPSGTNTILPCPTDNPCSHNPCGQGICELVPSLAHGYLCRCAGDVISLSSCNITQHGCHSNPCVNGLCIEGLTSFVCHCLPNWTGKYCTEKLPSPCAKRPCQNGRCFELNDPEAPYVCLCPNHRFDVSCQSWGYSPSSTARMLTTNITPMRLITTRTSFKSTPRTSRVCDPFIPDSCLNGGRCLATMHSYRCLCQPGFTGPFCEQSRHGGICYDLQASYMCFCPDGSFRTQCSPQSYLRSTSTARTIQCPCQNGGLCSIDGSRECLCPTGYYGRFCELVQQANKCNDIRCMNGGSCSSNHSSVGNVAQCVCKHGFTGKYCEIEYFRCRADGRFVDAYRCNEGKYFECIHYHEGVGGNSYAVLLSRSCPTSLRFNIQQDRCDYPQNVTCTPV